MRSRRIGEQLVYIIQRKPMGSTTSCTALIRDPVITPLDYAIGRRNRMHNHTIDLSAMGLTSLPEDFFHSVPTLQYLSLSYNNFRTFPERLFERNPDLRHVEILYNYCPPHALILPNRFFMYNRDMEELSLDGNRMRHLPPDLFRYNTMPVRVTLSRNELTHLPYDYIDAVIIPYAHYNPWLINHSPEEPLNDWIIRCNIRAGVTKVHAFKQELLENVRARSHSFSHVT
jgi:hypothetical protein